MTKRLRSKFKVDRRLLQNTWDLKKSSFNKKQTKPGIHKSNQLSRKPQVKYFLEKCKLKAFYANVSEKYLKKTFKKISSTNKSVGLLNVLERRLDSILFRCCMAKTFFEARQIINHKHVFINGEPVNLPSYIVQVNDKITFSNVIREKIRVNVNDLERAIPSHLCVNKNILEGKLVSEIDNVSSITYPFELDITTVIAYLNR